MKVNFYLDVGELTSRTLVNRLRTLANRPETLANESLAKRPDTLPNGTIRNVQTQLRRTCMLIYGKFPEEFCSVRVGEFSCH